MSEQMEFPDTFEKFAKEYGFKDDKEAYTNGSDLIPIFRVKQWLEHDNKLRRMETDTNIPFLLHKESGCPLDECIKAYEKANEYLRSKSKLKG